MKIGTPTQIESLKPSQKHSKEIYGKYKEAAEKRKGKRTYPTRLGDLTIDDMCDIIGVSPQALNNRMKKFNLCMDDMFDQVFHGRGGKGIIWDGRNNNAHT